MTVPGPNTGLGMTRETGLSTGPVLAKLVKCLGQIPCSHNLNDILVKTVVFSGFTSFDKKRPVLPVWLKVTVLPRESRRGLHKVDKTVSEGTERFTDILVNRPVPGSHLDPFQSIILVLVKRPVMTSLGQTTAFTSREKPSLASTTKASTHTHPCTHPVPHDETPPNLTEPPFYWIPENWLNWLNID